MAKYRLFVHYGPGVTHDPVTGDPIPGCDTTENINGVYWTGAYNDQTGCSNVPKCFATSAQMQAYANSQGEILKPISDMAASRLFCQSWKPPAVQASGTTVYGGVSTYIPQAPGVLSPAVAAAIAPSLTPGSAGAVPSGITVGQTPTITPLDRIYRFILYDPTISGGPYGSGANYHGCSRVNIALCDPHTHHTEQEAIDYAEAHGETPYRVHSHDEPWDLISGKIPIDPNNILGSGMPHVGLGALAVIAAALWFLSGR